jgi:hypothetical protein
MKKRNPMAGVLAKRQYMNKIVADKRREAEEKAMIDRIAEALREGDTGATVFYPEHPLEDETEEE